tara:strand:+ start:6289 stop:8523 length:2235 start_codon:yes stop_codon:yes gene_type:complete
MLSFSDALKDGVVAKNTHCFWVIKLYYNAEGSSDFIGLSDANRDDGADFYHGLITDFGNFVQSIDYFEFTSSISNMTLKAVNSPNTINGGRLSDLLSTLNFGNRKWELFQCIQGATPYDTAGNLIAQGIIAGDFTYNRNEVVLQLIDNSGLLHKDLPTNTVTSTDAPEENIGKPIPMQYGDFHDNPNIGTIPSNFDKIFPLGKFPAIITNTWDDTNNVVVAQCDSQRMHTTDTDLVFQYQQNVYPNLGSVAFATSGTTDLIRFSGASNIYYPLLKNTSGLADRTFQTGQELSASAGSTATIQFDIPKQPKLGVITDINLLCSFNNFIGSGQDAFTFRDANNTGNSVNVTFSNSNKEQSINIPISGGIQIFSDDELRDWSFESTYEFFLDAGASVNVSAIFKEVALEITYFAEQNYTQTFEDINVKTNVTESFLAHDRRVMIPRQVIKKKREITSPATIQYVYFGGKGRKFGSWVDARTDNGYDEDDLIENPIFIVEDIIRTELGSTDINTSSFDVSGNTSNGLIKNVFDEDNTTDIKFAFSQNKFINSKNLIENIGSLCGTFFFLSAGKTFKTATLQKDADYDNNDAVVTIDYDMITLDSIGLTPINAVRNSVSVEYDYDYAKKQTKEIVTVTDSTSQGTTVNGVNQTLKLELEADKIIDTTTATALANYYKDISKDRKLVIMFDVPTPKHNALEVGDIINFTNWDSDIKLFGSSMTENFIFIVTQTTKRPDGCEFVVTEVGRP